MDMRKIADLLRATIDPAQREEAENQLKQVEKIIGVAPALLKIIMGPEIEMPIRQAGAIYLKNMVCNSWSEPDEDEPQRFHIHEQDRAYIRDTVVDAVVLAPNIIRAQLCVCIGYICRRDFPSRWPSLVDKICVYLQSPEIAGWPGAFAALLATVKVFEYKKGEERKPLDEAMNLLLPLVQTITVGHLMNDASQGSLTMQRYVLKIFYALTQHHLPLSLLTKERFQVWMEVVRVVLDRGNPEFETIPADEDDKDELEQNEWWKTKKWAMRTLYRIFERYGSPGSVIKEYADFSNYYLNTFSAGALQVVFKMLDSYRQRKFVAEKVLRDGLLYLKNAVNHAHAWKFMKPHSNPMISDVIYPLLCHSDADERLWKEDPIEYVRTKYGDSVEEDSAVSCAEQLLNAMCKKRKGVLPGCLELITHVLNSPDSTPQQKDGALHMVGSIADILLKKDQYKDQFENVLSQFVFPSFACPFPYLRARAAWLLSKLSTLKFTREEVLQETLRVLVSAILNKDEELPVKVESAFAIESFIQNQHRTHEYIQPQVCALSVELLQILRATENDDLTNVLQKIVCAFVNEVAPIAHDICVHLANTFQQVMESTGDVDGEKTIVAMGLLNTMETVLVVMEEQPEVCLALEPILLQVVTLVLEKSIMEFYEEAFSLIASLTEKQISPAMWQVFEGLYRVVERDGVEYFVEMMPALHNYITVDTEAFLSDPNRVLALCSVIKKVLLDESETVGEDAECHAAKLIEVLILQCRHNIQNVIPSLLQLALDRLSRQIKTSELRTMCLQVVVASFYHDLGLTTSVVSSLDAFIKQWIADTDCFLGLHDRKICVLGLCALLQSPNRPSALQECSKEILPSLILLFDGLKRAYASKALENADSDSDEEEDDEEYCEIEEVLESDEDDIDDAGQDYLDALDRKIKSAKAPFDIKTEIVDEDDEDDDEDDFSAGEETALECYATPLDDDECPIDEYIIFKEVLLNLQHFDPAWYATLTNVLNEEQRKSVQEIFTLADQRKEAALSREIQKRGGFEFRQQAVPSSFNFGGGVPPTLS
ncbi:unnamed protein product [Allacma fusca]|uniref:Importin N-terminal domain-containing protein n=1 Tax=Allacma fusca TaxID=39272 RepID=A0A8J2K4V5_9HEXA|nr:unnamed protein product [Allacma fusca]